MGIKHNKNLDALRGGAALLVVLGHLCANSTGRLFDKNFHLGKILNVGFPAHMAVLVFFVLSGFVIGANTKPLVNGQLIANYIKKRLVRIVPIYAVAILFTACVAWGVYDLSAILSNLLFISVPLDNVMDENSPLWSLHYEIIYYFLFIALSFFNFNLLKTFIISIILTVILFIFVPNLYPLFISYWVGFIIWITGAMLAQIKNWPYLPVSQSKIVAIVLLIFCLQQFNPYGPMLTLLHVKSSSTAIYSWYHQSITYADLYYIPLTILLILTLTHSYSKYINVLAAYLYFSAFARLLMLLYQYDMAFIISKGYFGPALVLISSAILWLGNFRILKDSSRFINFFTPLTNISYGLYIIHFPVLVLFGKYSADSVFILFVKTVLYFIVVFALAYLLEMKFQPLVKTMFFRKKMQPVLEGAGIK